MGRGPTLAVGGGTVGAGAPAVGGRTRGRSVVEEADALPLALAEPLAIQPIVWVPKTLASHKTIHALHPLLSSLEGLWGWHVG